MPDCNCIDDEHDDIDQSGCPLNMGQVQKLAFATRGKVIWDSAIGDGTGLAGVPQIDSQLDTLADWQARRAAVGIDNTGIIVTPFIGGDPQIQAGEPITEGGGDNTSLNGVEEVTGTNPSLFTATFKSLQTAQEVSLKKVTCIDSEVYLFLEGGKIACQSIDGGKTHRGFIMQTYHLTDRTNLGFGTKDTNNMRFNLAKGWSERLVIVDPLDFNPLYDL